MEVNKLYTHHHDGTLNLPEVDKLCTRPHNGALNLVEVERVFRAGNQRAVYMQEDTLGGSNQARERIGSETLVEML